MNERDGDSIGLLPEDEAEIDKSVSQWIEEIEATLDEIGVRKATTFADVFKGGGRDKVRRVMGEYKRGKLKSHGRRVTSRRQAVAIAMSEAGLSKADDGDFAISAEFTKVDDEKRLVYGWASVIEKDGVPIIDKQGDIIAAEDLMNAAHDFMIDARKAGFMHLPGADGVPIKVGEIVESVMLTKDVQQSLGVDLGKVGWYIAVKVHDDTVWKMVKDGRLRAFSIGGIGQRIKV